MFILDRVLIGGLRFVFDKIAAAVDAELNDDTALREQLLAAQMRLELGEISEREFAQIERTLLRRIREVRERRQGVPESAGRFKVTGVEASVVGDDEFVESRDRGPRAR